MIEIYLKTNTNYDKNGDITLNPTSCTYKDSENLITLEHFIDDEGRWKYINFENVIAAEENGKKKFYRIYNVVRELYSVTAYARPIFYDLIDKVLLDVRPTNKIGQEALDIILADTGFTGHSNISTANTAYYVRKNIVEALLGDEENSFINRWGGEFYCENFDVYINDKIGSDNGVRVEFGYNLNEIEEDVNIEEVVTRIIPVGYNGIILEGNTPWVDSPLINKYTQPKIRVIEFSNIKVKESSDDEEGFDTIEEARAELIKQCNLLFDNGVDKPVINYKIDMINLANTTEYKDFKMLVEVNKGDTVTCYIKHLDIDVKARVIDYERDLITGEYTSIELGNVISNFFNEQADIQSKVNNILNSNGSVKAQTLEGTINAIQAQFKALKDVAQPQDVRAMLFEDRVEDSPTFGCMCIGTMGFEIASSFKPGTKEWDFRTFGTGKGFIADHIIAGILSAVLIRNLDGSFEIDLSKPGGALFKNNGKDAIKIENNSIKLYNWAKAGDYIGALTALARKNDNTKPMIGLVNDTDSAISIGYNSIDKDGEEFKSYIELDKYGILGNLNPITFLQDIGLLNRVLNIGKDNEHSIYNSSSDNLCIVHKDKILFVDKESGKVYFKMGNDEFTFYDAAGNPFFWKDRGRKNFSINGDLEINGEITGVVRNFEGDIIYDSNNPGGNGGTVEQNSIIESARRLIGKPYVWGGNYPPLGSSNGTDCSGLCQWAYNDNGITISRTTYTQINEGIEVTVDDLQPGDLVFSNFSSPGVPEHVYLYSGKNSNGELMCVEAPRTGLNIRERVFTWTSSMRARRILSTKALINENVELKNKILNLEERLSNLEKLYR
ncbi:MAG: phage tail protein [Clostridium sp.]|uniref:phage tail spike protein n=1 Tax=Clostridium sp. TaxID=1506 RepID=UPI0025C230D2|nr:phage tail spike protein [Clostridium sp.]MBS4957969.1 phage tail protein [Clostridium sp.]